MLISSFSEVQEERAMRFRIYCFLSCAVFIAVASIFISPLLEAAEDLDDRFSEATLTAEKPATQSGVALKLRPDVKSAIRILDQGQFSPEAVRQAPNSIQKSETTLKPIPAKATVDMARIQVASFNGVTPGKTTLKELQTVWGPPEEVSKDGNVQVQLYSIEPFDCVEASIYNGVVESIIIRLQKAFPASTVVKQLELASIRSVFVADETGAILGQAFPERGVLFSFKPSDEPAKPSMRVRQIILESISAEPFVLRAETNLDTMPAASAKDLVKALELCPDNARANWLYAKVLISRNDLEKAETVSRQATRLEPKNPRYQLTYAQVLSQLGKHSKAKKYAQLGLTNSGPRRHIEAKALCLLGDLASVGIDRDFAAALQYHTNAIKLADSLADDEYPAIRLAAKEVLIDAHLGAASDIAWGNWDKKDVALQRWLDQASKLAEDFVVNEGGSEEVRFRVAARALATYAGASGAIDAGQWADKMLETGADLVDAAVDPVKKQQLCWQLGVALYDALQIYQVRNEHIQAFKYGEKAVEYIEKSRQQMGGTRVYNYMLGRLYFRLGAILAVSKEDHKAAVSWFDKAVPILRQPAILDAHPNLGQHGETLVNMGVSYWEVGNNEQGLDLTIRGVKILETAAGNGQIDNVTLIGPYRNLSVMYGQAGDDGNAMRYEKKIKLLSEVAAKSKTASKVR